jgi:hypothetical protein
MKKNVGRTDQIIRIVAGIILVAVGFLVPMSSTALQVVLIIIGAFLLVTAFLSFCPLYTLLKINTLGK